MAFPSLKFEFRPRQKDVPYEDVAKLRQVLEQRDKELEDFLNRVCLEPCGGGGGVWAAARWASGQSLTGTGFNNIYWNVLHNSTPIEARQVYFDLEGGETNDRIHIYTEGLYRVLWEVYTNDNEDVGQPGNVEAHLIAVDASGPSNLASGEGRSISHAGEGIAIATGTSLAAMRVDDYFSLQVRASGGTGVDIVAWIAVEYAGPYGFRVEELEA